MGRFLQLLLHRTGGKIFSTKMFKLCSALLLAGVAQAAPGYGHAGHYHEQSQCHTKYDIKLDTACQTYYDQACHEEDDVVVDTTYMEEGQDIVTQHCQETSQQVHHSSAVVGHDSQVVAHGHAGYGKREAEPRYSTGPQCHDKKDRQCHKRPVQNERKVPRPVCKTIVDTTYIEECEETFTTQCHTAHTQVHHSSAVVGHDSQVVAHTHAGYGGHIGYGKREANAEPEAKADAEPGYGYSSGPQCHAKKDRQCHKKPVQNSRKVPRQVCVPVAREECHPIEVKVPRQVCNNFGYGVQHASHHGYGYGYGR